VAFVTFQSLSGSPQDEIADVDLPEDLRSTLNEANAGIVKVLPRYMVPTAYIPVNILPVLISGKTDRKRLRQFGTTVDLQQLDQASAPSEPRELTELELRLRQVWCEVLKLNDRCWRQLFRVGWRLTGRNEDGIRLSRAWFGSYCNRHLQQSNACCIVCGGSYMRDICSRRDAGILNDTAVCRTCLP
jgi:hypothetical protein